MWRIKEQVKVAASSRRHCSPAYPGRPRCRPPSQWYAQHRPMRPSRSPRLAQGAAAAHRPRPQASPTSPTPPGCWATSAGSSSSRGTPRYSSSRGPSSTGTGSEPPPPPPHRPPGQRPRAPGRRAARGAVPLLAAARARGNGVAGRGGGGVRGRGGRPRDGPCELELGWVALAGQNWRTLVVR